MIMSTPFGLLLDRIGNVASFLLSTLLEMAAIITFWFANKSQGGLFYLAFIFLSLSDSSYETVVPTIIFSFTNNPLIQAFGGTSVLIMVSVAMDTLSSIESQLKMHNYDGFFK